jgi:hypothetical protein
MARILLPTTVLTCFLATAVAPILAVATKGGDSKIDGPTAAIPGGVADAEGNTGYVSNPAGGIDAVNLKTGKLLWDTKAAAKPLALDQDRLVAEANVQGKANSIRIVVLDTTRKGKSLLESKPIVFPEWVSVGVTHGRSFASTGRLHKNYLLLSWEARAWYAGGARPTPQIEQAARKNASGVAQVNLKTGKVEMLGKDELPKEKGPKLPKELEDVKSMQYWTGSSWETKPVIVENRVAAITVENAQGKSALRLKTWDIKTAKLLTDKVLLEGKSLWLQLSPDHRYLAIHQAVPKESLPKGDYAWWIFSVPTGKQAAKIPFEPGTSQMTVLGPRAYFMMEVTKGGPRGFKRTRLLKAVTLKAGELAWERPLWAPPPLLPLP